MSLIYTDLSSVEIPRDAGFRIATINNSIAKLVENDKQFFSSSCQPGIWERRWYNDTGNKSLYYKKGDAVWINTEQADEFVASHIADIDMYAQGCAQTRYKLAALSAANDAAGISRLYRDMALGLGDFNIGIYYLGNLLDPVQIKISLSDDNDKLPTDSRYWGDFFDRSRDKAYYREQILGAAGASLSAAYDKHLVDYHLSGLADPAGFYKNYLQDDLTNISKRQKFVNHAWYQPDMTGFDCVVLFGKRNAPGDSSQCQWFRIWKSGMLEHGGIVKVADGAHDCGINDSDSRLYTVNFGWNYADGRLSPVYDFPADGIDAFYSHDRQIFTGDKVVDYTPGPDALGRSRRYTVSLTPVQSLKFGDRPSHQNPFPAVQCERFIRYSGREVTNINNGSFTFLYSPDMQMYSYYTRGFTVNKVRYY